MALAIGARAVSRTSLGLGVLSGSIASTGGTVRPVVFTVLQKFEERKASRKGASVVTYDTPREKLEAFALAAKRLISDNAFTTNDNIYVWFNDFGESSLNILVSFYLAVPNFSAELEEREKILLQVMDLANEMGVDFAFRRMWTLRQRRLWLSLQMILKFRRPTDRGHNWYPPKYLRIGIKRWIARERSTPLMAAPRRSYSLLRRARPSCG